MLVRGLRFVGGLSYRGVVGRTRRVGQPAGGGLGVQRWVWGAVWLDVAAGVERGVGEPATNRRKLFAHDQVQRRVQLIAASDKPCPEVEVRALVNFSRSQSSSTVEGGRVFPVVRFQVKRPDTFLTRFEIINFINFHFYLLPTPDRPARLVLILSAYTCSC